MGKTQIYLGFRAFPEWGTYSVHYNLFAYDSLKYTYEIKVKHTIENSSKKGLIEIDRNNSGFKEVKSGYVLRESIGSTIKLKAKEEQLDSTYQWYWVWNKDPTTSGITRSSWKITNGEVSSSSDIQYSYITKKEYLYSGFTAALKKKFIINRMDKTEFDGSFQTNDIARIVEGNSVNIPYSETLTKTTGTYNFSGWADGGGSLKTPYDNTTYMALYKMPHKSGTATSFQNTSQRKFLRTPDGSLHVVYESMGYVWYERSSDGGNTWIIMNGGKPLSTYPSKSPSIDYNGYSDMGTIGIVFQEENPNLGRMIKYFPVHYSRDNYGNVIYSSYALQDVDYVDGLENSSIDSSPVIAFGSTSPYFLVVWKGLEGLTTKFFNGNNPTAIAPLSSSAVLYSVSDQTSEHPFLVSNRLGNTIFHLAWDENTSPTTGTIRYCKLSAGSTVDVVQGSYNSDLSSGSGFTKNSMPSLIPCPDNTVRMSWLGATTYGRKSSAFRGMFGDGSWNPRFWSFGSNVASQCINLGSDGYYILFSDYTSGSYKNQFTDSRTLSNIYTLNTTGKDVQLNNDAGGSSRTMYAMAFSSQGSLPYTFTKSNTIGSYYGLSKSRSNEEAVASGRGIILSRNGQPGFYFHLENIAVGGTNVRFVAVSDTVRLKSTEEIKKCLITQPFTLQDTSDFTFSTICGVSDSLSMQKTLGDNRNITFRIQLMSDKDEVLGNLIEVNFPGTTSPSTPKVKLFKVKTNGIGSNKVTMRLTVENRNNLDMTMLDSYFSKETSSLNKSSRYEMIDLNGISTRVNEYRLLQNYPNPFNPSTVISYDIPKTSKVILKIYDLLGKEVTTLVDEVKGEGRYSVEFNASSLPSGIYIYEIRANDFVKSGKMMLLK